MSTIVNSSADNRYFTTGGTAYPAGSAALTVQPDVYEEEFSMGKAVPAATVVRNANTHQYLGVQENEVDITRQAIRTTVDQNPAKLNVVNNIRQALISTAIRAGQLTYQNKFNGGYPTTNNSTGSNLNADGGTTTFAAGLDKSFNKQVTTLRYGLNNSVVTVTY